MPFYTNLPPTSVTNSDQSTLQAFDSYYTAPLEVSVGTFDAIKGYFESRGFDKISADAVAVAIIRQSKVDGVNPMTVLDTMQGLDSSQLSNVVSEILNYNRYKTSFLGYAPAYTVISEASRNVESPTWIEQYNDSALLTETGLPITDEYLEPLEEGA